MYLITFNSMFGCAPTDRSTHSLRYYTYSTIYKMTPEAEKFNGWAAMLGFVAAFGAYATTGQIIPGIL